MKKGLLTLLYTGNLVCGASQSDPRGTKFWYNSYFILTIDVQEVLQVKGVPKKIWSMFFKASVKNQKLKHQPIGPKFCRGLRGLKINLFCFLDHIVLGPYIRDMAILK